MGRRTWTGLRSSKTVGSSSGMEIAQLILIPSRHSSSFSSFETGLQLGFELLSPHNKSDRANIHGNGSTQAQLTLHDNQRPYTPKHTYPSTVMDSIPHGHELPPIPARPQQHRASRLPVISESLITDLANRLLRTRPQPRPYAMPERFENVLSEEAANQENEIETLVDRLDTEKLRRILTYAVGVERNLRDINRNLTSERDAARIEVSQQEEWLWAEIEESTRCQDIIGQRDDTIIQLRRQLNVADVEIFDLHRDLQSAREQIDVARAETIDAHLTNEGSIQSASDNEGSMTGDDNHVLVNPAHVDFLQAHIRNLQDQYALLRAGRTADRASQEPQQSQSPFRSNTFPHLPSLNLSSSSSSEDSSALSSPTYQQYQSQSPSESQSDTRLLSFESFSIEADLSSSEYEYDLASLAYNPASPEYAPTSPVYSPGEDGIYNASPYYSPEIHPQQDHSGIELSSSFQSSTPDRASQHEDSDSPSTLRNESTSDVVEFLNEIKRESSRPCDDFAVPSIGQKRSFDQFREEEDNESYESSPKKHLDSSGWESNVW